MEYILSKSPVNRTAACVVSQSGCVDGKPVDDDELHAIILKLAKRQYELKKKLGIRNRSQLKNRKYFRKYDSKKYYIADKKLFEELLENGLRINELADIKRRLKAKNAG